MGLKLAGMNTQTAICGSCRTMTNKAGQKHDFIYPAIALFTLKDNFGSSEKN